MMKAVLASASPRRREILEMLGVDELTIIPAKGEEHAPENAGPAETVEALASAKAKEVAALVSGDVPVIAADTIVWFNGRVYGKPHSREEAVKMLSELSGNWHEVYTGVCIVRDSGTITSHETARVRFRQMSEEEIDAYVATGEPMDKAGAYGAQGKGSLFVDRIEGDFFCVMGLPVCRLGQMLNEQGVSLI